MVTSYALEKIRRPGTRLTGQRRLIFEIISRSDGHLDADEIYGQARQEKPRISLSTVYRTLGKFKEMGLITEHHLGQDHHHYEARHSTDHHHFVCEQCGSVIEFRFPLARQVVQNVSALRDFYVTGAEVHITGLCGRCRR
jgi:Fe2+ or Zn2+ uptake regulation protein